jgi:hypothetical protein
MHGTLEVRYQPHAVEVQLARTLDLLGFADDAVHDAEAAGRADPQAARRVEQLIQVDGLALGRSQRDDVDLVELGELLLRVEAHDLEAVPATDHGAQHEVIAMGCAENLDVRHRQ